MEPCKIRSTTNPSSHAQGLEGKEISSPFRSTEKDIFDLSSYRSRSFDSLPLQLACPLLSNCSGSSQLGSSAHDFPLQAKDEDSI